MMNKLMPAVTVALLLPALANAAENVYIPYIGADYTYSRAHAEGLRPNYQGFDVNIGTKYNDYFGTEVFYAQTAAEHKKTEEGKLKTSYRAYGLDVAAYLPLNADKTVDLIATGGIGEYVLKYKFKGDKNLKDTGIGYRIGGGMMYRLTDHCSLRATARYVGLDKISDVNHMVEYSAGVRYHF